MLLLSCLLLVFEAHVLFGLVGPDWNPLMGAFL